MKKLLILLCLAFSLQVSAVPIITVVGSSFNDSVPIALGSAQWVDVTWSGTYTTSDSIKIYVFEDATKGTSSPVYQIVSRQNFYFSFLSIPKNSDSLSRRINFTMPVSFPSGKFALNGNVGMDVYGLIQVSSVGIGEDITLPAEVRQINYYNLQGQLVKEPNGICIKEIIYYNGMIRREKLYRPRSINYPL